ncbi:MULTISPECIES: nuclear transport factor 2 family protein [unclassified Winogradskyella]|uniref:nuclear transport factor 2 family protein n=1 Tax=unclassified Winogradskyella TaxID=2615021 RepID=UPI0018E02B07|nr:MULTISPECIES: nuclear transport factor 2 family protein [unclassified Winogradskyella]
MKFRLLILSFFVITTTLAQNTEVHLFDIKNTDGELSLINQRNVSNNEGYDNQPSFYNDNILTYVSTRNNQTDIAKYNIRDKVSSFINSTPNGGEYSPVKIPNSKDVSAVRLDNDGKQRLYRYNFKTREYTELIKDLVVAYYTWYDSNTVVSAVIVDDGLNLFVTDIKTQKSRKYATNVGRSFHKIPNSKLVSFISKEDDKWLIKSLDPLTGEIKTIIQTVPDVEDMCWLIDGSILIPTANRIYKFNPEKDSRFSILKDFEDDNIQNITRITTNEIGTMLALVSEVSPEVIVQKQLDAYNARDIDAFMTTYTKDIKLYNFPNELRSEGQEAMKNSYKGFFESTPDLHCKILYRIVTGNKVIDHELVTANGSTFKAVAVYEVENGLISKVTFIN